MKCQTLACHVLQYSCTYKEYWKQFIWTISLCCLGHISQDNDILHYWRQRLFLLFRDLLYDKDKYTLENNGVNFNTEPTQGICRVSDHVRCSIACMCKVFQLSFLPDQILSALTTSNRSIFYASFICLFCSFVFFAYFGSIH